MHNKMTEKLLKPILAICLLFGSLYFPAYAETARQTQRADTAAKVKKTPEANFQEGDSCLRQGNISCAKLALASIPATSPYAKLLAGKIALSEQLTDQALSLLLPLQTDSTMVPSARIRLHESLATLFENLDDAQQAMQHLIQAEAILTNIKAVDSHTSTQAVHDRIWALLDKSGQAELVTLRGNNTDTVFQGWIDLRLAAYNQDPSGSIMAWSMLYPDHPAQMLVKNLAAGKHTQPALEISLASTGSIAVIMPLSSEIQAAKAQAFRLGLEAALNRYGLQNTTKIYPVSNNPPGQHEAYTLAKQEGNTYFIQPILDATNNDNRIETTDADSVLHLSALFADEIQHIIDFASLQSMQEIAIISTEDGSFREMAVQFESAWRQHAGDDAVVMTTLPADITAADNRLLELKAELAAKKHDMILLALPTEKIRLLRPYLQISTPTMTFSEANEYSDDAGDHAALNAIRLYDIPYLLFADKAPYSDYEILDADMNSNALLRWFALGVDSLQLLAAGQQLSAREISINGLTGQLTIDSSGTIKRALPLARFTHSGISTEQ